MMMNKDLNKFTFPQANVLPRLCDCFEPIASVNFTVVRFALIKLNSITHRSDAAPLLLGPSWLNDASIIHTKQRKMILEEANGINSC